MACGRPLCLSFNETLQIFAPKGEKAHDRVEVIREANYVPMEEGAKNVYVYYGEENTLKISRVYSTQWLCDYNMLYYPFDTQVGN